MAALDYAALRQELGRSRLLFVAHREEILDQSMATFRYALRDASFGSINQRSLYRPSYDSGSRSLARSRSDSFSFDRSGSLDCSGSFSRAHIR